MLVHKVEAEVEQWTAKPEIVGSNTVCCDMGQNDTIGKIELKIIFRLAVGISNSRNDIQLFLQLFDELRVNGDYH